MVLDRRGFGRARAENHDDVLIRRRRGLPDDDAGWDRRTITLIGTQAQVLRICDAWTAEGWQVMALDAGGLTPSGHETHVVRVSVPPVGWRSNEQLLAELEA